MTAGAWKPQRAAEPWEGPFADANKRPSPALPVAAQQWVAALRERQRARKPLSVPAELSGTATD